jgi:hypothetical protein
MDWRLRGLPAPLWRQVRDRAGDNLKPVLLGLLKAYAEGRIDPLSDNDPVAAARGAKGGASRAANMSADERSASARLAARKRWGGPKGKAQRALERA